MQRSMTSWRHSIRVCSGAAMAVWLRTKPRSILKSKLRHQHPPLREAREAHNMPSMTTPVERTTLLVSCYELGHQPAGIAMPMGLLRRAGYESETMDVSVEGFDADKVK